MAYFLDLEEMSFFDSQATTPTRLSLDHQDDQEEHVKRLETIPSNFQESNGERQITFDPSPSRSRRSSDTKAEEQDLEKEAGFAAPASSKEAAPEKDPNLVEWDGPDDPENPQNFSYARKWTITMFLSSLTIWVTFSTSVFSQATQITAAEFGVSDEVMILATSLPLFVRSTILSYLKLPLIIYRASQLVRCYGVLFPSCLAEKGHCSSAFLSLSSFKFPSLLLKMSRLSCFLGSLLVSLAVLPWLLSEGP
jgi:hypothetical protein